jgi:GNAT superfamily N-acetyltransferase
VSALDPLYESPATVRPLIEELLKREGASGMMTFAGGEPVAYVLGVPRNDPVWGPNVWIEDAGSAGADGEALREAYATAAGPWVAGGRTRYYVNVPASDETAIEAWFSLGFGLQQIHALREPAPVGFRPTAAAGLTIRREERADAPNIVRLDLMFAAHHAGSPVFSDRAVRTLEQVTAEIKAGMDDLRFTGFVAEHDGRVVGTAVCSALTVSTMHTALMRPANGSYLAYVAVLPDARGLGAGRSLAETVMAWARDEGYAFIAVDWRSANLEASRTWRSLGFRPSFYRLYRSIP